LFIAMIGSIPLLGAAAPEIKSEGIPRKSSEDMIKRFDTNHDGSLDEAERTAMRAAMAKKRQEVQKTAPTATPSAPDNGNPADSGETVNSISSPVADNATAILEAADPNQDLVQKKLTRHRAFVMTFDADKDGKLNDAERKAALEAIRLRR
jgi:hypothetical protein